MNILNFLRGKKTYICAAVIAVCAGLQSLGYGDTPEWVYIALAALTGISRRVVVK